MYITQHNMEDLKECISKMSAEDLSDIMKKAYTRKAFIDSLENPDKSSTSLIRERCNDLTNRITRLTPSRKDLISSWNEAFDVELFVQMFQNSAVDENDANTIVNIVFDRFSLLCAPAQDEAVLEAKKCILNEKHIFKKLALLLEISNDILKDIEKLLESVRVAN